MANYNRQQQGKLAEAQACQFLQEKGLILLEQNYHCFCGEIDLIMQDHEEVVFVEVRSRQRIDYGNAAESITQRKKQKLIKTATYFLQIKQWLNKINSRFDVIAIHPIAGKMQLEWIRNAFTG